MRGKGSRSFIAALRLIDGIETVRINKWKERKGRRKVNLEALYNVLEGLENKGN